MIPYETAIRLGEESGVRLEIAGGIPTWEAFPNPRHQRTVDRVRAGIRHSVGADTGCQCAHLGDVYIRFPDGSLKRPDISVFCRDPVEQTEAITMLPEAVIEIISPGYEAKDLTIGVPFYLRSGVKDIIVFDPTTNDVRHFRPGYSEIRLASPATIVLACGCQVAL